jgi:hypothetical protein
MVVLPLRKGRALAFQGKMLVLTRGYSVSTYIAANRDAGSVIEVPRRMTTLPWRHRIMTALWPCSTLHRHPTAKPLNLLDAPTPPTPFTVRLHSHAHAARALSLRPTGSVRRILLARADPSITQLRNTAITAPRDPYSIPLVRRSAPIIRLIITSFQ